MKKLIYLLVAFVAILFLCIMLIIPREVKESKKITVGVPDAILVEHLVMKQGWKKWWPNKNGISPSDDSTFNYDGLTFQIDKNTFSEIFITITDGDVRIPSVIQITHGVTGANEVTWSIAYPTSNNPVGRFLGLERAKEVAKTISGLLQHFRDFVGNIKNVYGIEIEYAKVQDSLVVTTKTVLEKYPDTRQIYSMVNRLRSYARQHAIDKGSSPMLNVTQAAAREYHVTVALPVFRRAPLAKQIDFKSMVLGNILVTEVHGGPNTVHRALNQLHQYIQDNSHTSPAIPFQVLLTDRMAEPDSTKWVTRLYYPIL